MCTVSWCSQPDGYTLIFNRDESRSRQPAIPPEKGIHEGCQYLCPRDPDGGGTWLLSNDHGLTLGLLNYYEAAVHYQPSDPQTRGNLPIRFSNHTDLEELEAAFLETDLSPFPPLHFLSVDSLGTARMITWDGQEKRVSHPGWQELPITTSSYKTPEVVAKRKNRFRETVAAAPDPIAAMRNFHINEQPQPAANAVLMTRPDARTVSVTRIQVTKTEVTMHYQARPDDTARLDPPVSLSIHRYQV